MSTIVRAAVPLAIVLAIGCNPSAGQAPAPAASSSAVSSVTVLPSASAAPSMVASVVVPPVMPPPITAPSGKGTSPPTPQVWDKAPEVFVEHGASLGCKAKLAREWVRVWCKGVDRSGVMKPVAIKITRDTGVVGKAFAGADNFLFPLRPGLDVAVTVYFEAIGTREFHASYPEGGTVIAGFDRAGPPDDTLYPPANEEGKEFMMRVPQGVARDGSPIGPLLADRTEVTVRAYRRCVAAGACEMPKDKGCANGNLHEQESFPVNCVTFTHAEAYCRWAGKRLPTEREWSYAALGADGRELPWGNDRFRTHLFIDGRYWAENAALHTTGCPVMDHPAGVGPFGLHDAAGNVAEWTTTTEGDQLVVMGGHFKRHGQTWEEFFADWRMKVARDARRADVGMRCVRDDRPER